ncbi:MAG: ABC transporter ATP-binding protein [Marmoricola sp.]
MTLDLEHVTLTYPDGQDRVTAVDDVSLHVARGSTMALVGPSGSGKSSLLAVAATLVRPDRGLVAIDGVETTGLSARELTALRRERIGVVFQQPHLLGALTAREQVEVMSHLGGHRRHDTDATALLDAVGMAPYTDRRPSQLSGGQQQRVNIARALAGKPALLLVDEPTSALDHERGAEVMDLLRRLTAERDLATLVVTHDTALLSAQDRVVRMRDGRLSAEAHAVLSAS